jgi:hypothetical protein
MRNKNAECRSIFSIVVIAALLLTCMSCGAAAHPLEITGDCEGYTLTNGAPLAEIIRLSKPRAEEFDVLLMGNDGMVARVAGDELDGCAVMYSRENLWEIKSELHPPSARVKFLDRVVVVPKDEQVGQLLLRDTLYLLKEEGTSRKNGRSVTVYTTRMTVPLPGGEADLIEDLPDLTITETYRDALGSLRRDERVLIIELDGLGWEMLQRADAPFLASLQPQRALACYPPISPTGLASMLTGESPDKHGVRDRETRGMNCEDLFAKAEALGKASAYVEGSHALLQTSLAPVLSLGDEETLTNAQQALAQSPDLLFVHFHGIDDAAHKYGPYGAQTLEAIKANDGYVRALCEGFDGRVIVTADHGLHKTPEGGNHGEYLTEDMIVPYIIV